jgi:DNA-binding PadR family transcriptional regulator
MDLLKQQVLATSNDALKRTNELQNKLQAAQRFVHAQQSAYHEELRVMDVERVAVETKARKKVEQLSTEKAVFLRYFSERFQAEFLEQYRSQTDRLLGKGGGKPIPQLAVAAVAVGTKLGKETKDEGKEVKEKEGKKRLVLPFHSTYAQGAAAATGNIQASITPAEQTENRMTATLADAGEIAVQREEQVVYFSLTEAGAELCASATRSAVRAASDLWEELEDAQFPLDERKERKRNTKNNKNSRKEVNGNRAIAQNAQSPSKISSPSSNGSPINGMRLVQFGGDKPPPPISERGNKGEREGGEGGGDDEKEEEEEDVQPDEFSSDFALHLKRHEVVVFTLSRRRTKTSFIITWRGTASFIISTWSSHNPKIYTRSL